MKLDKNLQTLHIYHIHCLAAPSTVPNVGEHFELVLKMIPVASVSLARVTSRTTSGVKHPPGAWIRFLKKNNESNQRRYPKVCETSFPTQKTKRNPTAGSPAISGPEVLKNKKMLETTNSERFKHVRFSGGVYIYIYIC